MTAVVYRFTRDLRLDDHAGLAAAAAYGAVIPVLVIDPPLEARLRASPRRAAFFCGAVAALDRALHERGESLVVRRGKAAPVLKRLASQHGAHTIAWSASFDAAGMREDERLQSSLEEANLRALIVPDASAIAPEESTAARPSAGEGYRAFVPYHELWRDLEPASYEVPLLLSFARLGIESEALPEPAEFGAQLPLPEHAHSAQQRFEAFLEGPALTYAGALASPAEDRTSHLSADLSFGTISARFIVRAVRRRIDDPFLLAEERASLRRFLRSMAFRDFFLQLSWYNPQTAKEPLQEKMRGFPFAADHPGLDAWRDGRTGYPLVDAGIRQLRETGWMHPLVRSIAASFLCFDLGVDWRTGMAEWDRLLVEDDIALATGNWQWIAGVGADLAAYPRIFNPVKQARRFDPEGIYARRWISELRHVPGGVRRAPAAQVELPLFSENPYPQPVVDHDTAARSFLTRYQSFLARSV